MSQTLMVRFGADTSAARRAVADLAATVATNAVTIATAVRGNIDNVQKLDSVLQALPGAARMAVTGFLAFKAVELSIGAVTKAMEEAEKQLARLVEIGGKAQGAGVGTTFLQSWLAQAKGLNVEAGTLEGMLKRARAASTVKQGTGDDGPASEMQTALGQQAKAGNLRSGDVAAFNAAADQEGRIRVVLDLIDRLMVEGRQLAALNIAGQMFGSDFEEKLRSGISMTARMRESLDGLKTGADGRIIPPEEIERAQRITATLDEAARIMTEAMRPVNEDLARLGQQQALSWAEMKVTLAGMVSYLSEIYKWTTSIGESFAKWGSSQTFKDLVSWMNSKGLIDTGTTIPGIDNGFEKAGPDLPAEGSPLTVKITPRADRSRNLPKVGSNSTETDPVDSFIKGIERSTAALKAEVDAYDKSNAGKRVAIELAKAEEIARQNGKTLTEEQTARITAAATAAANMKDRLADLDQAQRQAAESARYFGQMASDALGDMILDGAKATDVLNQLWKSFAKSGLNAIMTGTGPLAGFFGTAPLASAGGDAVGGLAGLVKGAAGSGGGGIGSLLSGLFGGFRANGGDVQAGRLYRINELGGELFAPNVNGRVIPAGAGGGGGMAAGGVTVIDQRRMDAPPIESRAGPGGSQTLFVRDAENAMYGRAAAGRGRLAPAFSSAGNRRG